MVCIGKHPLLLLLDEFPSLGKMDIFQDAIAFFAGYNVKLFLITQSKSQLEDEGHGYGKAGGSVIIENCHVRIFYAPNDVTTAEWLSKTLGKKTVPMENTTQSLEGSFLPSPKGQSRSITWQARDLLTPDEVLRLRGPIKQGSDIVKAGDMIVMVSGFAPVYGRQILYFKNTVFLERAQKSPPAQSEPIRDRKNYRFLGEHGGVLAAKPQDPEPGLDDMDFADEMPAKGDVAEGGAQDGQSGSTSLEQLEAETTTVEEEEEAATGEVQGDLTQDREVLNVQKDLARLAEMLPPEIKAASGGEDAWRPNATRLDRHEDRRSMDGLLGGKAS